MTDFERFTEILAEHGLAENEEFANLLNELLGETYWEAYKAGRMDGSWE